MDPNVQVRVSKSISYLLRHGATKERVEMDKSGYVKVDDVIVWLTKTKKMQRITIGTISHIVNTCPKKRFQVMYDDDGQMFIRAAQGHSLEIDEGSLEKITDHQLFPIVVHGTYERYWNAIRDTGLNRMGRQHIHFAITDQAAHMTDPNQAISGMRASCNVLIYLDLEKALADGIPFFRSENNVILSPGVNDTGAIPSQYFQRVVERKTGKVIFPLGK